MTPRHLLALALALACLAGVLKGCATPGYQWYPADAPRMDWYRWEVVERGTAISLFCGKTPPDRDKACVIRLRDAVVKPGDVHLRTGEVATERGTGTVCLILSTVDEEGAKRIMEQAWEDNLRDHEVERHCRAGLNHSEYGRK